MRGRQEVEVFVGLRYLEGVLAAAVGDEQLREGGGHEVALGRAEPQRRLRAVVHAELAARARARRRRLQDQLQPHTTAATPFFSSWSDLPIKSPFSFLR